MAGTYNLCANFSESGQGSDSQNVGMQGSDSQKVGRAQILRMWAGLRFSESGQGADSQNVGRAQSLRKWAGAQILRMWAGLRVSESGGLRFPECGQGSESGRGSDHAGYKVAFGALQGPATQVCELLWLRTSLSLTTQAS